MTQHLQPDKPFAFIPVVENVTESGVFSASNSGAPLEPPEGQTSINFTIGTKGSTPPRSHRKNKTKTYSSPLSDTGSDSGKCNTPLSSRQAESPQASPMDISPPASLTQFQAFSPRGLKQDGGFIFGAQPNKQSDVSRDRDAWSSSQAKAAEIATGSLFPPTSDSSSDVRHRDGANLRSPVTKPAMAWPDSAASRDVPPSSSSSFPVSTGFSSSSSSNSSISASAPAFGLPTAADAKRSMSSVPAQQLPFVFGQPATAAATAAEPSLFSRVLNDLQPQVSKSSAIPVVGRGSGGNSSAAGVSVSDGSDSFKAPFISSELKDLKGPPFSDIFKKNHVAEGGLGAAAASSSALKSTFGGNRQGSASFLGRDGVVIDNFAATDASKGHPFSKVDREHSGVLNGEVRAPSSRVVAEDGSSSSNSFVFGASKTQPMTHAFNNVFGVGTFAAAFNGVATNVASNPNVNVSGSSNGTGPDSGSPAFAGDLARSSGGSNSGLPTVGGSGSSQFPPPSSFPSGNFSFGPTAPAFTFTGSSDSTHVSPPQAAPAAAAAGTRNFSFGTSASAALADAAHAPLSKLKPAGFAQSTKMDITGGSGDTLASATGHGHGASHRSSSNTTTNPASQSAASMAFFPSSSSSRQVPQNAVSEPPKASSATSVPAFFATPSVGAFKSAPTDAPGSKFQATAPATAAKDSASVGAVPMFTSPVRCPASPLTAAKVLPFVFGQMNMSPSAGAGTEREEAPATPLATDGEPMPTPRSKHSGGRTRGPARKIRSPVLKMSAAAAGAPGSATSPSPPLQGGGETPSFSVKLPMPTPASVAMGAAASAGVSGAPASSQPSVLRLPVQVSRGAPAAVQPIQPLAAAAAAAQSEQEQRAALRRHRHAERAAASAADDKESSGASAPPRERTRSPLEILVKELRTEAEGCKASGNAAYERQQYDVAEKSYTQAISRLQQVEQLITTNRLPPIKDFNTELAVLYSNRAGARLMTGKPRPALEDARRSMQLDPKFFKAVSRAATCYCRKGQFEAARKLLDSALDRLSGVSPHYRDLYNKMLSVNELHGKAAKVAAAVRAASSNKQQTADVLVQVALIKDEMAYCEVFAAIRASVHLRLGQFAETIAALVPNAAPSEPKLAQAPWRLWIGLAAKYFQGDLAAAAILADKLRAAIQEVPPAGDAGSGATGEASDATAAAGGDYRLEAHVRIPTVAELDFLVDAMKQLLKLKEEGNAALKAGKQESAIEKYTSALQQNCCPVFAALLYCNRAAAHQAAGSLAEAVADCCRSKALNPTYYKAYSRLAGLLSELARPDAAVKLLETCLSSKQVAAGITDSDRRSLKERVAEAEGTAKWQKTPEHFKMLSVGRSCSDEDVRKAYRKLALRNHPDKAVVNCKVAFSIPAPEDSPVAQAGDVAWPSMTLYAKAEVESRVKEEASWFFTLINEANEQLADEARRRKVVMKLESESVRFAQTGAGTASKFGYGTGSTYPTSTWASRGAGQSSGRYSGASHTYDTSANTRPSAGTSYRPAAAYTSSYRSYSSYRPTPETTGHSTYNTGSSSTYGAGAGAGTAPGTAGAGRTSPWYTADNAGGYSSRTAGGVFGSGAGTYGQSRKTGSEWWDEASDEDESGSF